MEHSVTGFRKQDGNSKWQIMGRLCSSNKILTSQYQMSKAVCETQQGYWKVRNLAVNDCFHL